MKNIDTNKIVVSNKVSFSKKGFKYFISQKDAYKNQTFTGLELKKIYCFVKRNNIF